MSHHWRRHCHRGRRRRRRFAPRLNNVVENKSINKTNRQNSATANKQNTRSVWRGAACVCVCVCVAVACARIIIGSMCCTNYIELAGSSPHWKSHMPPTEWQKFWFDALEDYIMYACMCSFCLIRCAFCAVIALNILSMTMMFMWRTPVSLKSFILDGLFVVAVTGSATTRALLLFEKHVRLVWWRTGRPHRVWDSRRL